MLHRAFQKAFITLTIAATLLTAGGEAAAQGNRSKEDSRELSKPDPYLNRHKPELLQQGAGPSGDATWSVVIASVAEADAPEEAEKYARAALERVQTRGGLSEAFLEKRNKAWVILFGKYDTPDGEKARSDLSRIHDITVDGAKPFTDAYLCPPSGDALRGSIPDFDLRNAKKSFGKNRARYTLQVGVYGRDDKTAPSAKEVKEFREAAEKAAVELRREGEMAFYFHGPERSTVTVGLFTFEDIDPKKKGTFNFGGNNSTLDEARNRHPYNLLNGQGIKERVQGVDEKGEPKFQMQKTMLVEVPN